MRSLSHSRRERRHSLHLHALSASLLVVASTGCTLFAGEPWGEAELKADVRFSPEASRLTDDGALKTAKDYALVLETLTLGVREIDLVMSEGGTAAAAFDPANPPPGYSLCHGGHCHADDGRLVDYDDIAIEVAGAGGAGEFTALRPAREGVIDLLAGTPVEPSFDDCLDDCLLPRGSFVSSGMTLESLVVDATVFDLRPASGARLPASGVAVSVRVPLDARVDARVEGAIDDTSSPRVEIVLHLEVTEALFDGVDFAAVLGSDPPDTRVALDGFLSVTEAIAALVLDESSVNVDVDRPEDNPFEQPELVLWNP
jgi:hypothetical protein